jgi:hypothetical protein
MITRRPTILVAKMPDKLKEMQKLFDEEAAKYNVLPLNNDTFARATAPRPSATAGQTDFTYSGVMPGIPLAMRQTFSAGPTPLRLTSMCLRAAGTECS